MMQDSQFGKVAVLMGGQSAEREISLKSGTAVLHALTAMKIDAHAIDVTADLFGQLKTDSYTRAFIALHGSLGENGCIQGGLKVIGLPYSGSGVMASSICMNKLMTKKIWQACGIPTPKFCILKDTVDQDALVQTLGLPIIFKPASQGSSIGVSKVESKEGIITAWKHAREFEETVIAEQWINGNEYTIAILNDRALPVIHLETPRVFYDFNAKYQADDTQYHCPCGLAKALELEIQDLALQAFQATDAIGWGRVDIMLDEKQQPWFLEVNTVPGMTNRSLVPMAAKAAAIPFNELVVKILATSFTKSVA